MKEILVFIITAVIGLVVSLIIGIFFFAKRVKEAKKINAIRDQQAHQDFVSVAQNPQQQETEDVWYDEEQDTLLNIGNTIGGKEIDFTED